MMPSIADSLVLVLTEGMSLGAWQESGLLTREWALYAELLKRYRRLVVVSYAGASDQALLDSLVSDGDRSRVVLVCNDMGLPIEPYKASVPGRVRIACQAMSSVVVKTNQMQGGDLAVPIVQALREAGLQVGLIARGGYLWSRFVAYEHGPESLRARECARREETLCRHADMVVGTTDEMVQDLSWRYGLDPLQTAMIPNYVLTDRPASESCERERGLLLYAGQLVARKRVDVLIRALAQMSPELRSRLRLEIYGSGPDERRLKLLAQELAAPVHFRPRILHDELLARMGACLIYLQASELEGHPKTVIEAMAAGAPVVVADAPGLGSVVQHGVTGLRCSPEPDQFRHAIEELLSDEDWRDALGSAASASVRAMYGLPKILTQEVAAHRKALAIGIQRGQGDAAKIA